MDNIKGKFYKVNRGSRLKPKARCLLTTCFRFLADNLYQLFVGIRHVRRVGRRLGYVAVSVRHRRRIGRRARRTVGDGCRRLVRRRRRAVCIAGRGGRFIDRIARIGDVRAAIARASRTKQA